MGRQTRWESTTTHGYGVRFAELVRDGADIDGEARLVDVLAPRGATVLDAGSGMGRVAAGIQRRGHTVTAVEKDPALVAQSEETFPSVPVVPADLIDLTADLLESHGLPTSYDVIAVVGNVIVFLAPDSEVAVLARLRDLLTDSGRIVVGFHPAYGPGGARDYAPGEFEADVAAAGLAVAHRFGTYELHPPAEDYCVYVLQRAS